MVVSETLPVPPDQRRGSVRSIERAFLLLETLAKRGGTLSLSQLAVDADMPLPTIHRLLRTLADIGYVRQDESRKYSLGARLFFLADQGTTMLNTVAQPHLSALVDSLGETVNLAMLDGTKVVYVCQAPSRHSMRMFTEVGRRVDVHCTAVGKVLMASLGEERIRSVLLSSGMPAHTPQTITDPDEYLRTVRKAAEDGFAIDDGEQEVGVRCVGVALVGTNRPLALSASGPAPRMDTKAIELAVPALHAGARSIAQMLAD